MRGKKIVKSVYKQEKNFDKPLYEKAIFTSYLYYDWDYKISNDG